MKENAQFILAVGGGSVIDSAECMADRVLNPDIDPWKYFMKAALPDKALPHNGLTGLGRDYLMQVHQLEHELSGLHPEIAHGAGFSAGIKFRRD